MNSWVVCCDFDGTICIPDSTEFLLEKFGLPGWKELDDEVWQGRLTEREAFTQQVGLLRVSWEDARRALHEGVIIRDGFSHFVKYCRNQELPITILSSGLGELIRELLRKIGADDMTVVSQRARIEDNRWTLIPWTGNRLADHCSHCKCAHLAEQHDHDKKVVYIGDGFTDLCPSQHADLLFATGKLAQECKKTGRKFSPFDSFFDIENTLKERLQIGQDL